MPRRYVRRGIVKLISSSLTLIIGDALRLGRPGPLGGKGQNDQGDQVGQQPVQVWADPQLIEQKDAVPVDVNAGIGGGNALEQAEEQGRASDV